MLAETTDELALVFRREVHDALAYVAANGDDTSSLWKDVEIFGYMTEASDKLARKTEGLYEVSQIGFAIGAVTVPLPPHILKIREARLVNANQTVLQSNADGPRAVVRDYGIIVSQTLFTPASGRPTEFVRDYDVGLLRFDRTPTEADTLELQSSVTIPDPLGKGDDVPFTETVDQRLLLEYMKYIAYRKQDAETEDLVRSNAAKAVFDKDVEDRAAELRKYRRAAGTVRMEWWP